MIIFPGENLGERDGGDGQGDVARGRHENRRKFHEYKILFGREIGWGEGGENR